MKHASARYLQLPVLDRWRSSKILDGPTFPYRAIDLHLCLRLDGAGKAWIRQEGQEVNHTSSKIQHAAIGFAKSHVASWELGGPKISKSHQEGLDRCLVW